MYKMVLNITKETWGNCDIKTVKYYSKKEDIIELWEKTSDVETQTKHSNIAEVVLGRIKKFNDKKAKSISEEEKQKYKAYFEGETGISIIEKLTLDIIGRCRLPEAVELRKKLG